MRRLLITKKLKEVLMRILAWTTHKPAVLLLTAPFRGRFRTSACSHCSARSTTSTAGLAGGRGKGSWTLAVHYPADGTPSFAPDSNDDRRSACRGASPQTR